MVVVHNGAYIFIFGDGWNIIEKASFRRATVHHFNRQGIFQDNLDIVSYIAAVVINGAKYFFRFNEAIYDPGCATSVFSEYQMRSNGISIDSVPVCFGGGQTLTAEGVKIPLGIYQCLK